MIQKALGIQVKLQPGQTGQFDVQVDGETLDLAPKGFLKRLFAGRWPDEGDVVDRLRQRMAGTVA